MLASLRCKNEKMGLCHNKTKVDMLLESQCVDRHDFKSLPNGSGWLVYNASFGSE